MRETGILMAVSSLPGPYGAGDLGPEAMRWIDLLAENGVTVWQLLPLGPTGYGNSPYQTYSSRAGDPLYLSLEALVETGLLPEKPAAFDLPAGRVDYEQVRRLREPWLRRAYGAFRPDGDYAAFAAQGWVRDYAVFAALKARHGTGLLAGLAGAGPQLAPDPEPGGDGGSGGGNRLSDLPPV